MAGTRKNDELATDSDRTSQFLRLYSAAQPRLFAYILTMVPAWHDAEEVLQDTSVVLWKAFDQFELGTDFWAWSSRTAFHQVLSFRKRMKRAAAPLEQKFIEAAAQEYDRLANELDDQLLALPNCLDKLSPDERELVTACYEPGVTIREVAARLGRPDGTVYKSLTRIRRTLLKCINEAVSRANADSREGHS